MRGSTTEALATVLDASIREASVSTSGLALGGSVSAVVDHGREDAGIGAVGEAAKVLELGALLRTARAETSLAACSAVDIRFATVAELGAAVAVTSAKTRG